ncbi:MAG: GtrA family protein [Pseudomonadota bacterium]
MSGVVRPTLAYIVVGRLGAVSYMILANLLAFATQREWIAGAVANLVLTPVVYMGHHRFTFLAKTSHQTSLLRYLTLQFVGFNLSWSSPFFLLEYVPATVALLLVSVGTAIVNLLLMKRWAFVSAKMV